MLHAIQDVFSQIEILSKSNISTKEKNRSHFLFFVTPAGSRAALGGGSRGPDPQPRPRLLVGIAQIR